MSLSPDDRHWATAGRAAYFRARAAAALGQRDEALGRYAEDVRSGAFPEEQHTYKMQEDELKAFERR